MLFNKYEKLQNIGCEKTEWSIRVRAQAVWEGITRATMEFRGLNVIFIDDSNCRIHAFVSSKIAPLFQDDLKEGKIFSISNFHVRTYEAIVKNRAIRNEKHIYFDNYTVMEPELDNITCIAPYAFDLFDFGEVDTFLKDSRFLIDVVGVIQNTDVESVFSKDDQSKSHIKFRISDGRSDLKVAFFNTLAVEFEKELKQMKEEQVIVIISSAKVTKFDGETCLNNYPATRFYLNPDHYSVPLLKKRVADLPAIVEAMDKEVEVDDKLYTIAEIKKFTEEYVQKKVRCQVNVKKVEEKNNWYDNFCTTCGEEVNIVAGRYKCETCKRNIPYPDKRFRLAVVCKDMTGVLAMVFPEEEIYRLTGKDVFDIENDDSQVGDGINFPLMLKAFENRDYIVTLLIDDKNIKKSCSVYTACALDEPVEMLGNYNPGDTVDITSNADLVTMEIDVLSKRSSDSPPTEKSSNKIKLRKHNEVVSCELDENVPVGRWKNIKKEV